MACYGAIDEAPDDFIPKPNCEHGIDSSGNCKPEPPVYECGNGALNNDEACDDGNQVSGDGCSEDCTVEICRHSTPLALGKTQGSLASEMSSNEFHAQCDGFAGLGRERVYEYTSEQDGTLLVAATGGVGLYGTWSCSAVNSVDTAFPYTGFQYCSAPGSAIQLPVTAGEVVYVVVDSTAEATPGPFELTSEFVATCGDGQLQIYADETCDAGNATPANAAVCSDACELDTTSYCAAATSLSVGTHNGDTSGGVLANRGDNCYGNDELFAFTAPSDGVFFAIGQASFDMSLKLMPACNSSELLAGSCSNEGTEGQQEAAVQLMKAGETVWLVVDGTAAGEAGSYQLSVDFTPSQ